MKQAAENAKLEAARRERMEVLEKMRALEAAGEYHTDVEPDPPGHELGPDEVDYLRRRPKNKLKTLAARALAGVCQAKFCRDLQMTLVGEENLSGLVGGVILTGNHFSKYENLAAKLISDRIPGRGRLYRVVKGTNYFLPGAIGFLMKNCDTLPLSQNLKTMRLFGEALEELLSRGEHVLIYPEQAMWWNYRRPRPFKPGAFHYAAKHGVPILPYFITMEDTDRIDEYGFPMQKYTIHIMPPIYPDPQKSLRENERRMQAQNYELCCRKYEEVYGHPV